MIDDILAVGKIDNGELTPQPQREEVQVATLLERYPDPFMFGSFAQMPAAPGDSTRKDTGLGLAFCRLVVEAHGVQLCWVEDALEVGATSR